VVTSQFSESTPAREGWVVNDNKTHDGNLPRAKANDKIAVFLPYAADSEFKTDWYLGTIKRRPARGKFADVIWDNGDPQLMIDVSEPKRGISWVRVSSIRQGEVNEGGAFTGDAEGQEASDSDDEEDESLATRLRRTAGIPMPNSGTEDDSSDEESDEEDEEDDE
jgi:hypothetical protein